MSARNVWHWLVLNQKYIWAGLYLLAIPGFGWAYSKMERAFYAPNMRLEQSYSEDAKKVADAICSLYNDHRREALRVSDIERALEQEPDPKSPMMELEIPEHDPAKIAIANSTFRCYPPVTVSGDEHTISVAAQFLHADANTPALYQVLTGTEGGVPYFYFLRLSVNLTRDASAADVELYHDEWDFPSHFDPEDKSVHKVTRFGMSYVERTITKLRFGNRPETAPILSAMSHFINGDSGFTSDVSDNFQRMLYFSAVTITTLGFGDIVPITTAARRLVTCEAVFGVVMIGLFLNSLTRKREPR
jgi:hypothetical protein